MSEGDEWKEVGKLALRVIRKAIQTYLEEAERRLEEVSKAKEQTKAERREKEKPTRFRDLGR